MFNGEVTYRTQDLSSFWPQCSVWCHHTTMTSTTTTQYLQYLINTQKWKLSSTTNVSDTSCYMFLCKWKIWYSWNLQLILHLRILQFTEVLYISLINKITSMALFIAMTQLTMTLQGQNMQIRKKKCQQSAAFKQDLVLLESCLKTCMTYTIAECTVNRLLMMDRRTVRNM
jgi:hypothetical protein